MIKKIFTSISMLLLLSFSSCGDGDSSKEAKEVLQQILQFVGIPQTIIANICQDSNRDGICGSGELFTKLNIHKGDSVDDIWKKISLTPDGKYFLENVDTSLPILVELQDETKVDFDSGKFTLEFNALKNQEQNETKEISILESMIDKDTLNKNIADKFRTLQNQEAQDKYYRALLDSLETNINILRVNGLESKTAVTASIKEMGDETKTNQEQANRINNCGSNLDCIDNEIKKLSDELVITGEEINQIIQPEPIANGGEVIYDGKWVKISEKTCTDNGGEYNDDCYSSPTNARRICTNIGYNLADANNLKAVVSECGGKLFNFNELLDVASEMENTPENQKWLEDKVNVNSSNSSYRNCYKEKGFTYNEKEEFDFYITSSSTWTIDIHYGAEFDMDSEDEARGRIRCIK